jgi:hypothetical protein
MFLERARKVALVLLGLLFVAGVYPWVTILRARDVPGYPDAMLMSIYATLGVFLLLAARNPSANRSLIAFSGWANLAHAATMTIQGSITTTERDHLWGGGGFGLIGIILLLVTPKKPAPSAS